jgi:hypothetical protein
MVDLEEITAELDRLELSTSAQRQLLYSLGRSRHFVRKFCKTKAQASECIRLALNERAVIEMHHSPPDSKSTA